MTNIRYGGEMDFHDGRWKTTLESLRYVVRTSLPLNVLCVICTDVETSTVQELVERGLRVVLQFQFLRAFPRHAIDYVKKKTFRRWSWI